MKHLEFIHRLSQFCIEELNSKREELAKLTQNGEEEYSYHSTGYLSGQIIILQKILNWLIHYDIEVEEVDEEEGE